MLIGNSILGGTPDAMAYYLFLALFIAAAFLGCRLYATWDLYEILCGNPESISDYLLARDCINELKSAFISRELYPKLTIPAAAEGGRTTLTVSDHGCGIDSCDIGRIFDLFFTGKNGRLRGESSGLGLYMVKKVLDYLGHPISVASTPGEGTRVQITFSQK